MKKLLKLTSHSFRLPFPLPPLHFPPAILIGYPRLPFQRRGHGVRNLLLVNVGVTNTTCEGMEWRFREYTCKERTFVDHCWRHSHESLKQAGDKNGEVRAQGLQETAECQLGGWIRLRSSRCPTHTIRRVTKIDQSFPWPDIANPTLGGASEKTEPSLCLETFIPNRFLTHQDPRISGTTQCPSPLS